jgi:hypothetical protein
MTTKHWRTVRRAPAVLAACAVLAGVSAGIADVDPAASASAALRQAMTYAPDGAVALVHVEVRAMVRGALEALGQTGMLPKESAAEVGELAGKIGSLDVFVQPGVMPMPLGVVRGRLSLEDLKALAARAPGGKAAVEAGANGRYLLQVKGAPPVQAVLGSEADDVPDDVVLMGLGRLAPEDVAELGRGKAEKLRALLGGVDTAAPVWGAADLRPFGLAPEMPQTVRLSLHVVTRGRSRVEAVYGTEAAATQAEQMARAQGGEGMAAGVAEMVRIEREGATVVVSSKGEEPLIGGLMAALGRLGGMPGAPGGPGAMPGGLPGGPGGIPDGVDTTPGAPVVGIPSGPVGTPSSRTDRQMHFVCAKCGHHFVRALSTLPHRDLLGADIGMMGMRKLDCPKCGAEHACWEAMTCPRCGKHFISQTHKALAEAIQAGKVPPADVRDVCPHCGCDVAEHEVRRLRKEAGK